MEPTALQTVDAIGDHTSRLNSAKTATEAEPVLGLALELVEQLDVEARTYLGCNYILEKLGLLRWHLRELAEAPASDMCQRDHHYTGALEQLTRLRMPAGFNRKLTR